VRVQTPRSAAPRAIACPLRRPAARHSSLAACCTTRRPYLRTLLEGGLPQATATAAARRGGGTPAPRAARRSSQPRARTGSACLGRQSALAAPVRIVAEVHGYCNR
jgi:hypothetical protein